MQSLSPHSASRAGLGGGAERMPAVPKGQRLEDTACPLPPQAGLRLFPEELLRLPL